MKMRKRPSGPQKREKRSNVRRRELDVKPPLKLRKPPSKRGKRRSYHGEAGW